MLPKQEQELQKLIQQERTMRGEMETFKDIEWQMHELEYQIADAEETQKVLKTTLNVTVSAVNKSKARLAQFEVCYSVNSNYSLIFYWIVSKKPITEYQSRIRVLACDIYLFSY